MSTCVDCLYCLNQQINTGCLAGLVIYDDLTIPVEENCSSFEEAYYNEDWHSPIETKLQYLDYDYDLPCSIPDYEYINLDIPPISAVESYYYHVEDKLENINLGLYNTKLLYEDSGKVYTAGIGTNLYKEVFPGTLGIEGKYLCVEKVPIPIELDCSEYIDYTQYLRKVLYYPPHYANYFDHMWYMIDIDLVNKVLESYLERYFSAKVTIIGYINNVVFYLVSDAN